MSIEFQMSSVLQLASAGQLKLNRCDFNFLISINNFILSHHVLTNAQKNSIKRVLDKVKNKYPGVACFVDTNDSFLTPTNITINKKLLSIVGNGDDEHISMCFCYDQHVITTIKNYVSHVGENSNIRWNATMRAWEFPCTVENLEFCYLLSEHLHLVITPEVKLLWQKICQMKDLKFDMILTANKSISNAPKRLKEYLHSANITTMDSLVWFSGVLGYDVGDDILQSYSNGKIKMAKSNTMTKEKLLNWDEVIDAIEFCMDNTNGKVVLYSNTLCGKMKIAMKEKEYNGRLVIMNDAFSNSDISDSINTSDVVSAIISNTAFKFQGVLDGSFHAQLNTPLHYFSKNQPLKILGVSSNAFVI